MKESDRQTFLENLENSKTEMLAALEAISADSFSQPIRPEVWSVAQIVDHVIQIEQTIISTLHNTDLVKTKGGLSQELSSEEVMRLSADRTLKSKAPEAFLPKDSNPDKIQAIEAFKETRHATIDFVKSTQIDLRNINFPHPRIGLLNGEHWLVFISGHSLKHVAQINEFASSM